MRNLRILVASLALAGGMGCLPGVAAREGADSGATIQQIDSYAGSLDELARTVPYENWTRARGGDWHLSAMGTPRAVRYLRVELQLGRYVRSERYYFRDAKLVMARVCESWDVDSPREEPEKPRSHTYYVSDNSILGEKGAVPLPAHWLVARAETLLAALAAPTGLTDRLSSLEEFPW